ncbi:DUF3558 domain-containing protein [Lentzea kentuckyensis]|uniref:DUF3558 domain-containing protein n=1 Tax=Lentzea kentuckyensis TaxID=360086 RepID=UPI000A377E1E|nr:DUF3558 domain-containing protein [Lentzea kentuckyensis]
MKRILIATVIGLATLSGCTGTAGDPKPAPTTGGGTPTSSSDSASGLKALKPCELLTQAEVTSLKLEYPGEPKKVAFSEGCDYKEAGSGGLRVGIRAQEGLKDLKLSGDKVTDAKIGKFEGKKVEGSSGSKDTCTAVIAVTESATVEIISNASLGSDDTAAACDRMSKAADLVAAKLP